MSSSTELHAAIKQMIVERLFLDRKGLAPEDLTDDADLMDAYDIDSVELFEIVVGLEEEYGVALPEDEFSIEKFRSVDRIVGLVEQAQAQ
jgi:acyl carrier protein